MMSDIFTNSNKPFYRFGDVVLLEKIKRNKWVSFITAGFASVNKEITQEDAGYIADLMLNHPWYVQQLSHICLNQTIKKAGKNEIKKAIQLMMQSNSPLYEREIEFISATQLNLIKAILQGEKKLTAKRVMDDYKLGTPNNVSKNKASLKENDIIDELNNEIELLGPVFELWFWKRFFNEEIK